MAQYTASPGNFETAQEQPLLLQTGFDIDPLSIMSTWDFDFSLEPFLGQTMALPDPSDHTSYVDTLQPDFDYIFERNQDDISFQLPSPNVGESKIQNTPADRLHTSGLRGGETREDSTKRFLRRSSLPSAWRKGICTTSDTTRDVSATHLR